MAVIQLTSPLILASDPTLPLHLVTKRYADAKVTNLSASGFSSGTLSVARLPQFLGDVTMPAGGGTLTVTPTGVTAGTYTKVTVSSSGRILAGSALTAGDVPPISWNKIVSGKPTTLAGYGITDALTASGGTITGDLSITTSPVNNYHLANKNYVDGSIVPGGDSIVVGDIVRVANVATPAGFLRANGGKVSKTTYAALYSIIGDRYEVLLNLDTASPWRRQAGVRLSGEPVGGLKVTTLPAIWDENPHYNYNATFVSFVIKNKMYTSMVGTNGGQTRPKLIRRDITSGGELINPVLTHYEANGWTNLYPNVETFVLKNYVYVTSGEVNSNANNNIRRAEILSDGNLGAFNIVYSDSRLLRETKFVVVKNRLYMFNFWFTNGANPDGSWSGPCEYGYFTIDTSGNFTGLTSLGTFFSGVNKNNNCGAGMNGPILDAFVFKEKLIVLSGNSSNELSSYYASINSDGSLSSWTKGVALASHTGVTSRAVTTTNGAYIFHQSNNIYKLNFDAAGVPVSWSPIYIPPVSNPEGGWSAWYSILGGYAQPVVVSNRLYPAIRTNGNNTQTPYIDFSGGLNDYTPYTDGSLSQPDPLNFFLPDFTAKETATTKYFIKT